jgi:HD-GYP domain-containing protein (c-di-GMP phosphodiesterase class II)
MTEPTGRAAIGAVGVAQRKITRTQAQKIAAYGQKAVSTLYTLMRNVKMYDPDNEIFQQPLQLLADTINSVVAADQQFNLQAVGTMLALNGVVIKVDFGSLENLRALTNAFKEKDLGGFQVSRSVKTDELKSFLRIFYAQGVKVDEDGNLPGIVNIRVGKYRLIRQSMMNQTDQEIQKSKKIDRNKYALTVYARGIAYMRHFLEAVRDYQQLPSVAPASRVIRDFIDLSREGSSHFLGLSASRSSDEYLAYHSVNTSLLSVVMGTTLGLNKEQLHDLGRAAIFHDIGVMGQDQSLIDKQGALTPDERARIKQNPLIAARILMRVRPLDIPALKSILAAHESKIAHFRVVKEGDGVRYEETKGLGVFGRIIRVASTFDALTSARPYREAFSAEMAMTVMGAQMKNEFDPFFLDLLRHILAHEQTVRFAGGRTVELFGR